MLPTRHRRGPYALAQPSVLPGVVRTIILVVILAVALFFTGRWILSLFGSGSALARTPVVLIAEGRGPVNVSLEGGAVQRAEDSLKLYDGDRVTTGNGGHALLLFFDGSRVRLDAGSDVTIDRSERGSETSTVALTLTRGSVFVQTPTPAVFSGTVLRTIRTTGFSLALPTRSEAVVNETGLLVFSANGLGIGVSIEGRSDSVTIGEGQQWQLPAQVAPSADLYSFRSPLPADAAQKQFVIDSRAQKQALPTSTETGSGPATELLAVTEPENNVLVKGTTVRVAGLAGKGVMTVRINGYIAAVNPLDHSFQQELTLQDAATTDIHVEALDDKQVVLTDARLTVRRDVTLPDAPVIVSPAQSGQTYRTQALQLEISGTAKPDVAGIIVNDYRLQLFKQGSVTWSYLASTQLKNLVAGKNVFTVVAIDAAGNRSPAATLTILLEDGPTGVVATEGGTTSAAGAASSAVNPATLPDNAPLSPGSLSVTGPTAGTLHTATGSEIVIVGATSSQTASIWVNDYRLQLYKAGKTTWNYIASVAFANMKKGRNVYVITARDAEEKILDRVEYIVNY